MKDRPFPTIDMKIAWTPRQKKIWLGEIAYEKGVPKIENRKMIIDNSNVVVDRCEIRGYFRTTEFQTPGRE